MMELLKDLFASQAFMPQGHCYLWKSELMWLHVVSDLVIAIACYSIPITLIYFARKRDDLPFHWIVWLFGAFVVAGGTTHAIDVWTLWHPTYWLSGLIKAIAACLSVYAALALVQLVPKAIALPSSTQLEKANLELEREITERKQIEEALRQSESRYRAIVEDQTELICRFTPDGTLTFVNDAVCRYAQVQSEILIGRQLMEFVIEEDREILVKHLGSLNRENPVGTLERRSRLPNGEVRWQQWIDRAIFNQFGEAIEFQCVGRDITDRKRAEEELRHSKLFIEKIADTAPQLLYIYDITTHRNIYINHQSIKILGYAPEEVQQAGSQFFLDNFHPDDLHVFRDEFNRFARLRDGEVLETEFRMRHKNGSWRWLCSRDVVFTRGTDGSPEMILGTALDITAQKLVETQLRESEERFRAIFKQAAVGIVQGTLSGQLLQVNQRFCDLVGYTESELLSRTFHEITYPDDLEVELKYAARLLAGEIPNYSLEKRYIRKDGQLQWVNIAISVVRDPEGVPQYGIGVAEDISERKRAEEQIQASLKEKEVLLAEIHHRVKNNLHIISNLLYLQANRSKDSQVREVLQESRNRVDSMALVHESLYRAQDFAQINLSDYVRKLSANLLSIYKVQTNTNPFTITVDSDILLNIDRAIPCGLIVNELITNALKHGYQSNRNCEVFVTLEVTPECELLLKVGNTGNTLPDNFDIQNSESMGLKLIVALVKQLKGTLEFEKGDLTIFKIKFSAQSSSNPLSATTQSM